MQYRKLGKWGLRLSVIGLGSYLTFGHSLDLQDSRAIIRKACEGGVKISQIEDNIAAGEIIIPDDVTAEIERIFPAVETVESER